MHVHKQFIEANERLKQLVEQHYKEPVNGQFKDCAKKSALPEVLTENSNDKEDQDIASEE